MSVKTFKGPGFRCTECDSDWQPGDLPELLAHRVTCTGWHGRAVSAVKRLAAGGGTFTFWDVAKLAGEPADPRSQWGKFAQEVKRLGIAKPVGYALSDRPETRSSAVRTWRAA